MKTPETNKRKNDGITQEDIDKAIERLVEFYSTKKTQGGKSSVRKIKDDGKHLTIQLKPDPNSPIDQIREGKPIKIKTIFHAIEIEIKDQYGARKPMDMTLQP